MSECKSCGAELEWARTVEGHRIPLDKVPVPDGNILFDYMPTGAVDVPACSSEQRPEMRLVARVLTAKELERLRDDALPGLTPRLYKSHFATCPDAARYRKPKPKKKS
jgi:hypothetical protein